MPLYFKGTDSLSNMEVHSVAKLNKCLVTNLEPNVRQMTNEIGQSTSSLAISVETGLFRKFRAKSQN